MPTIRRRVTLAAAGNKANPLVGSQYEYLPFDAIVEAAIVTDVGVCEATMFSGTDVLLEDAEIPVVTTEPKYPDDYDVRDVAAAGERIGLTVRKISGASSVVTAVVKITPA